VVWLRMSGVPLRLPARDGWVAALLGAITAFYTLALLSAIGAIPLALAILVFYLFPLVATVTLAVCGWEKLGRQTLAAIVLAFAGLTLALNPHGGGLDLQGVALALVGALGLGIVIAVSSRVFRAGDSRPVTLYIAAVAAVVLIVLCAAHGELVLPQTGFGCLGVLRIRDDRFLHRYLHDRTGARLAPLLCRAGSSRGAWRYPARRGASAPANRGHRAGHRGARRRDVVAAAQALDRPRG
jgi:hypothetical protein